STGAARPAGEGVGGGAGRQGRSQGGGEARRGGRQGRAVGAGAEAGGGQERCRARQAGGRAQEGCCAEKGGRVAQDTVARRRIPEAGARRSGAASSPTAQRFQEGGRGAEPAPRRQGRRCE